MLTHTLGFPRMGLNRELKRALEGFWKGDITAETLKATARDLRTRHWNVQQEAGIDLLPVGDFSLYDHMLDMAVLLGCVPGRYGRAGEFVDLDTYFRMARGGGGGNGVTAMEMTKWFDTNYHYLVPEFEEDQEFCLTAFQGGLLDQAEEAVAAGHRVKAVLPGPYTFLLLGKGPGPGFDPLSLLSRVAGVYEQMLERLSGQCEWVQFDEPVLALDLPSDLAAGFRDVYERLLRASGSARVMVATYFGSVAHNAHFIQGLALDGLHLDLVRAPEQLDSVLPALSSQTVLSAGVVDGRNIWRVNAEQGLALIRRAADALGVERVMAAPSCSLLHAPVDLDAETDLDPEVRQWMAFATQKCREVRMLADAASGKDVGGWLEENRAAWEKRRTSRRIRDSKVRGQCASVSPDMLSRTSPFPQRREAQRRRLSLPLLPTTTIGSFPQTSDIRKARRDFKQGGLEPGAYERAMRGHIRDMVGRQEALGLDVLVHGEPERNDMVEYFGEQLRGFCFTKNGWVQSYGSRCVKPPVIYGDVSREQAMTVPWFAYAQSLTQKPVKGMLTGPVTILCWSFVRDDQPRDETCRQIALAIRGEVLDLERAGAKAIQIDEPALREGLPLRGRDRDGYLRWAVDCFCLAANGVRDETQIHTHMCYAEFNEIIGAIAAMDADVISIEASRSRMELLRAFGDFQYPNEIGPGVYDIHSPRVPSIREMEDLLGRAAEVIPKEHLWVNPDCGLKTRDWPETLASLENMVAAAANMRRNLAQGKQDTDSPG